MKWLLAIAVVLAACGRGREREPVQVPARWRIARLAAGHMIHVGKLACADCHRDGFAPPPLDTCTRCHAVTSWLHRDDITAHVPACIDCHPFGTPGVAPWACLRCHDRDQGRVARVGAHADQPCDECHQPHHWPGTLHRACTECHVDKQTHHAGLRGCRDCHAVHEATRVTLAIAGGQSERTGPGAVCVRCHATQPAALHVDARANTTGHPSCATCHQPHGPRGIAARACAECHRDQPMLAPTKHACASCHDPHVGGAVKACTTCHQQVVSHPKPTPQGACIGCHPPHDRTIAIAEPCTRCHAKATHATATCLDCHAPHGGRPARTAALCARCHTAQVSTTAGTGHARCELCHPGDLHRPQPRPPGCESCHPKEVASAPVGHATCTQCHQPHAPKPTASCATCHAREAAAGHGPLVACERCHRAHGPGGVAPPPACTTCHAQPTLAGLHHAPKHADCAACHRAHEVRPSDDRATCTACHRDRVNHEPTAIRCATCHPFR